MKGKMRIAYQVSVCDTSDDLGSDALEPYDRTGFLLALPASGNTWHPIEILAEDCYSCLVSRACLFCCGSQKQSCQRQLEVSSAMR